MVCRGSTVVFPSLIISRSTGSLLPCKVEGHRLLFTAVHMNQEHHQEIQMMIVCYGGPQEHISIHIAPLCFSHSFARGTPCASRRDRKRSLRMYFVEFGNSDASRTAEDDVPDLACSVYATRSTCIATSACNAALLEEPRSCLLVIKPRLDVQRQGWELTATASGLSRILAFRAAVTPVQPIGVGGKYY